MGELEEIATLAHLALVLANHACERTTTLASDWEPTFNDLRIPVGKEDL